jgi:hypothetical protein
MYSTVPFSYSESYIGNIVAQEELHHAKVKYRKCHFGTDSVFEAKQKPMKP